MHSSRALYYIDMVMWSINILSCSDQKLWNGRYEAEMNIIHTSNEHPKDEPRGIKYRNPGWRLNRLLICLTTCKSAIYRHFLAHMDWKLDLFICLFFIIIIISLILLHSGCTTSWAIFLLYLLICPPPILIYFSTQQFFVFMCL